MDIKDKVALITGGARIGRTVALELAKRGGHVAMTYRTSHRSAKETVRRIRELGSRGLLIRADLRREKDVQRVPSEVVKHLGRLDILVHMASVYQRTPLNGVDASVWDNQVNTDLRSAYLLASKVMPRMRKKGGRIIFFSDWISASGRPHYKDYLPYYVAKHGVIGLAEGLALEWAPGILVNSIAPGPILKPADLSSKVGRKVKMMTPCFAI